MAKYRLLSTIPYHSPPLYFTFKVIIYKMVRAGSSYHGLTQSPVKSLMNAILSPQHAQPSSHNYIHIMHQACTPLPPARATALTPPSRFHQSAAIISCSRQISRLPLFHARDRDLYHCTHDFTFWYRSHAQFVF